MQDEKIRCLNIKSLPPRKRTASVSLDRFNDNEKTLQRIFDWKGILTKGEQAPRKFFEAKWTTMTSQPRIDKPTHTWLAFKHATSWYSGLGYYLWVEIWGCCFCNAWIQNPWSGNGTGIMDTEKARTIHCDRRAAPSPLRIAGLNLTKEAPARGNKESMP